MNTLVLKINCSIDFNKKTLKVKLSFHKYSILSDKSDSLFQKTNRHKHRPRGLWIIMSEYKSNVFKNDEW